MTRTLPMALIALVACTSTSSSTSTSTSSSSTSSSAPMSSTSSSSPSPPPSSLPSPPPPARPLACDVPFDLDHPAPKWSHRTSTLVAEIGAPNHRARDLLVAPGERQWLIAKFAYGVVDKDLERERVHVYVLRDCARWELLGEASTSDGDDESVEVEGVKDTGGRVFFEVPRDRALGLGRHRFRVVVDGDRSSADGFVVVREHSQPVFVSDVDGTLTVKEFEEFTALLDGVLPAVHEDAPAALGKLARAGLLPIYVTARPEWLTARTRELLDTNGFPPGVVITTPTTVGALGEAANRYKSATFARLKTHGFVPAWAFGNQPSDTDAYEAAGVPIDHRVFFQLDDPHGGRRIERYGELSGDPAFGR